MYRVPAILSSFQTAGWGKIWRIKEAKGSHQSSFMESSLKLPHDTSNYLQNLIIWLHLCTRDNRKCYIIWDKIFPAKNCHFYSHGRKKEWILNNGSLYSSYNSHFYRWGNEHSESNLSLMTHLVHVRARIWISFFLIQIWHRFHYTTTSPSFEIWNSFFFTMIFFSLELTQYHRCKQKMWGQVNAVSMSQHQPSF